MAFLLRDLSVLAYANGFTLWHYRVSGEDPAGTTTPGFFGAAGDVLSPGDLVMVSGPGSARILCLRRDASGLQAVALS